MKSNTPINFMAKAERLAESRLWQLVQGKLYDRELVKEQTLTEMDVVRQPVRENRQRSWTRERADVRIEAAVD